MKTLKKILSLSISALGVLVLSGFLSLRPIGGLQDAPGAAGSDPAFAHHEAAHACNDLTGVTAGVPSPQGSGRNAGVEDSGNLDFNADPPAQSYQTCAERGQVGGGLADGLAVRGEDVWFLKGWTWNTNLGYISFYCDGGQNFGGNCSDQANPVDYETILESSGQVTGWAWGDNIGWISMTCRKGDNVGQDCGRDVGTNYSGVRVVQDVEAEREEARRMDCTAAELGRALQRGDFYGYAWSDSVGWLNFCGAHVELESPLVPEVTIETSDSPGDPGPGPGGCAEMDMLCGSEGGGGGGDLGGGAGVEGPTVYANGSDFYKIIVKVKDGENTLDQAGLIAHGVNAESFVWDNKLRANQVTRCTPIDEGTGLPPCEYNGNLLLPLSLTIDNWNNAENGLVGYVRAIAPTGTNDHLTLTSFNIVIDGISHPQIIERSFVFLPAVEVTSINSGAPGEMEVIRGSNPIFVTAERSPIPAGGDLIGADSSINIDAQLYDCSDEFDFRFDSDFNPDDTETWSVTRETGGRLGDQNLGDASDRINFDRPEQVCPAAESRELGDIESGDFGSFSNPLRTLVLFADEQTPETDVSANTNIDKAFGFLTRVGYTADNKTVKYFSLVLPDQSLLNQAADVRGNVRIDIQKILREGAIAQSLKNNPKDTQSKREKFYRAIKNTINTKDASLLPGETALGGAFSFTNSTSRVNGLRYFNTTNVPGGAPCEIILNNTDPAATVLNFGSNVTIVGEGCDFFIDQNIISPTGRLGIVALEDLSLTGARRGGNVYICHRVTDMEANIVADGSIFAYGAGETDCGGTTSVEKDALLDNEGLPNGSTGLALGEIASRATRNTALRQLTIIGSIVSNNTYGGAFESPPLLGDGTLITNPSEINKVRLYDINFLRYARTRDGDEDAGEDPLCWANEAVQLSQRFGTTCDANNPRMNGIINIIYRAPAKDMKIFGAVR